jgi:hypothetical protein
MSKSEFFDGIYNNVVAIFGTTDNLTPQRIIILTPRIIQLVQEFGIIHKMNGQEKKDLFFILVKKLVETSKLDDEVKQGLYLFIDTTLPFIVDGIVFAYKSEAFDEIKKKLNKKCSIFCGRNSNV